MGDSMCEEHSSGKLTRRGFAGLLTVSAALSLLPIRAAAAGNIPTALSLMCIDYRFINAGVAFFNDVTKQVPNDYDLVAMAGASLAGIQTTKFPKEKDAFYEQVGAARFLHPYINRVIVLDHLTCGAYKEEFGPMTPEQERQKHEEVAQVVWNEFLRLGLHSDFFILDDKTLQITRLYPHVK